MNWRWWRRRNEELEEEVRGHLEMAARERAERGESRAEAETAARRQFGNVELVKEVTRDAWGWRWLEQFAQDLRYGARQLRRNPGFTVVAILTLALGIGANTAIFNVLDAVLIKTLPVRNPESLVLFEWQAGRSFRTNGMSGTSYVSDETNVRASSLFRYETFASMQRAQAAAPDSPLSDLFAFAPIREINAVVGEQAEVITGQVVSGGYFAGLGLQPAAGRGITEEDDKAGAAPVVVLSHQFWQERFGGDPKVIGESVRLNQQSFTIVGVMPQDFTGTLQVDFRPAVTVAVAIDAVLRGENSRLGGAGRPGAWWLDVMGRLKPGATREQARASLDGAFQAAALEIMPPPRKAGELALIEPKEYPRLRVESGSRGMLDLRRFYAPTIYGMFVVVGLVLLIACANVANLLLARAASRDAEMTVRIAIGAGRGRLFRQLLTESLLLGVIAGAAGVLLAAWGSSAMASLIHDPTDLVPNNMELSVNWRVLAFTLGVSCVTGMLFGLVPAWRTRRVDLTASLKQSGRTTSAIPLASKLLIVTQVAVSLALLVGAGVYIRTLQNLQNVPLGFNQENLLVFRLQPKNAGYTGERLQQFYQRLFARLDTLPGVRAATFGHVPLIAYDNYFEGIFLPGEVPGTDKEHSTFRQMARENYFATLEIPFLRGRNFTAQDDANAPRAAIVNRAFAREFFPNEEVLGKSVTLSDGKRKVEIIGIVADNKYESQRQKLVPVLYTPWQQEAAVIGEMSFVLRTMGEPTALATAVRHAVRELDSSLPVTDVSSQVARSQATLGQERLWARLVSFFAGLALLLAAVGLAGILAYSVSQRTNEIGIRMALGAQTADVLRLVIGQGMKLVLVGVALGVSSAYAIRLLLDKQSFGKGLWQRRISQQLYDVSVNDPLTVTAMGLLLISVAFLACWVPAQRAARVDPMIALRHE